MINITIACEFNSMEKCLLLLVMAYHKDPSHKSAKAISTYLAKLLLHEDIHFYREKYCEYLTMQRFWQWHSQDKKLNTSITIP